MSLLFLNKVFASVYLWFCFCSRRPTLLLRILSVNSLASRSCQFFLMSQLNDGCRNNGNWSSLPKNERKNNEKPSPTKQHIFTVACCFYSCFLARFCVEKRHTNVHHHPRCLHIFHSPFYFSSVSVGCIRGHLNISFPINYALWLSVSL